MASIKRKTTYFQKRYTLFFWLCIDGNQSYPQFFSAIEKADCGLKDVEKRYTDI
jgi:hypothetical protein